MTRAYLAVDGGGSSTEFLLVNETGEELLRFFVGSTSKKSIGATGAQANIALGARKLCTYLEEAADAPSEIVGVWGLSGCDSAADQAEYEAMLVAAGLDLTYHSVVNDSLLALRTCVPEGPGIVLIAGTGSICVGVGPAGETVRLGGWGYQVSDLGSGCWVGSRLLREALLFDDGCREDDPVFALVYEQAGCAQGQLGSVIAQMSRADQWASFARLVMETPASPVCATIAQQAAGYLAGYVQSVASRLFANQPFDVVLAGGLFKAESFAALVRERIGSLACVHALKGSPAAGGIALAKRIK